MNKQKLGKRLTCLASAIALAWVACAADATKPAGPKCTYQNLHASIAGIEAVHVDGFTDGNCYQFPINWTLTCVYVSCLLDDPAGDWPIFPGVSVFQIGPASWGGSGHNLAGYWDEWLETAAGNIHLHSFGAFFDDSGIQTNLSRIVPDSASTGRYAGATGVVTEIFSLQDYDPVANLSSPTGTVNINGYICTP
jgi:hypothetical protein